MTLHAFTEYIKHRWLAKGRHGTHSPFVYSLVENVLLNKGPIPYKKHTPIPELELRYENLFNRIAVHFNCQNILRGSENKTDEGCYDLLLLNAANMKEWGRTFEDMANRPGNNSIIFVADIHKTAEHTESWNSLRKNDRVRLSADLFGAGLLFFRAEFKEKQHFVLRY